MINPTKKRLAVVFTSIIVVFNALILLLSYIVLHESLMSGVKRHLSEDIRDEFIDQYRHSGLTPFKSMWDENHLQILSRDGKVVISTPNSENFYPRLNRALLAKAFAGKQDYESVTVDGKPHLVSYFPLDVNYVGRAAVQLDAEVKHEETFVKMIFVLSPLMLLVSYLVSRLLLNHAMKPISDVFTFQETFSSNVTHELRSPLASIKGNFEVALRKERSAGEYREVIESGLRETDRIINLLKNLSLLSSSKFKPLDLYKNRADINRIVDEVVASHTPEVNSKWITFDMAETPGLTCVCDEELIRRTVENLVDNAVKYTPSGGRMSITLSQEKGRMLFTVTNTCEPIGKDELNNLFAPFARGKKSHLLAEGKGLGLYIVDYIVRSHGGQIVLNDTDNRTFSITVSLPA